MPFLKLRAVLFSKKKTIIFALIILVSVVIYTVFIKPTIETHTWELFSAQQVDPPHFVVAHHHNYTLADDGNDNTFKFSKPIELTCVAQNGKLTITDKTNNKTYYGTYKVKSWNRFTLQRYEIVINGKEGTANISSTSNRTLFISVDGYYLHFVIK